MTIRYAGVDVGSTTTKAVIINDGGAVVGTSVQPSGTDLTVAAGTCLNEALEMAGEPPRDWRRVQKSTGAGSGNT